MKFRDLNDKWMRFIGQNCSEAHYNAVRCVSQGPYFKPFRNLDCPDISRDIIRQLYKRGKWGSPNSANRNLALLKANLNHGVKEGWIDRNPIDKMPKFRQPKPHRYVPPRSDVEKVAKVLPGIYRDIYDGYRYTGARSSELRHLKWKDVDFVRNEIILYTRKKRDRSWHAQPVTIIPELLAILKRRQGGSVYVFGERERPAPQFLNRWIKRACNKLGISAFTTHALRHYAAHTMAERGAPTELIQRVLRHEDIKTTQRYLDGLCTAHGAAQYLSDTLYTSK